MQQTTINEIDRLVGTYLILEILKLSLLHCHQMCQIYDFRTFEIPECWLLSMVVSSFLCAEHFHTYPWATFSILIE